ncbi:MAG TPA: hypothetical protein VGI73_00350 [Solirubrobacterales bacterium]
MEHCPRCRTRDKVQSPLAFKAFDLSDLKRVDLKAPSRLGFEETAGSS